MAWIHRIIEDGKIAATHVNQVPPEKYDSWWESLPLYAAPPKREWVELTFEEADRLASKYSSGFRSDHNDALDLVGAVEYLLKEKNT